MSCPAANKPGYFNSYSAIACCVWYSREVETLVYLNLEQPALHNAAKTCPRKLLTHWLGQMLASHFVCVM